MPFCNSCSLSSFPAALGALTSLQELHVGNNKLTSLPDEIGLLCQLQILKANNNRYYLSCGDYLISRLVYIWEEGREEGGRVSTFDFHKGYSPMINPIPSCITTPCELSLNPI